MNKMEKALGELGEMDALAAENSPIHRLSPLAKLLTTITYLVIVLSYAGHRFDNIVPSNLQLFDFSVVVIGTG